VISAGRSSAGCTLPRGCDTQGLWTHAAGYAQAMSIIAFLVIGLIAGALARLIVPGRDPMGLVATMVLGIGGAIVGGFLARALFHDTNGVGLFGSTVGAVILLVLWHAFVRRQRSGLRGMRNRVVH